MATVKIMFPSLTHSGQTYNIGEIEENPTPYLLEAAKQKTKQFHRDTNKWIRIAKLVRTPVVDEEDDDEPVNKDTSFVKGGYSDDLDDMKKPELTVLASSLGMKREAMKRMKLEKMRETIRVLRSV